MQRPKVSNPGPKFAIDALVSMQTLFFDGIAFSLESDTSDKKIGIALVQTTLDGDFWPWIA